MSHYSYAPLMECPRTPSSTESLLDSEPSGSHKVHFHGAGSLYPQDFVMEAKHKPVDLSLILPHFRARNQPLGHRFSMFVSNDNAEAIKVKVCRGLTSSRPAKFHLQVYSASGDVTVWLPSDFKGRIHRSSQCKRVNFSAGFTNRIMQNVQFVQSRRPSVISGLTVVDDPHPYPDIYAPDDRQSHVDSEKWQGDFGTQLEDEVVIDTTGNVTFRMWDVQRGEPEARCKEACKRVFSFGWCSKRSPEVSIDWDFLLDD